jgi:hypothetical protein
MTSKNIFPLRAQPKAVFHLPANIGLASKNGSSFFKCRSAGYTSIAGWDKDKTPFPMFLLFNGAMHESPNDGESHACNRDIARSI